MRAPRIRTLHILTSLNRRGAETFAVLLVDRLSREAFDPAIWTIRPPDRGPYLVPHHTPVLRSKGGRSWYHALLDLKETVGTYQPHLIQCHGGRALKYAMMLKPFWRAQAYVYTKIGSVHPWLDHRLRHRFYAHLFEQVDAIVAVGEQVRREVETEFHPRRPRLLTIYTGREVKPFLEVTPEVAARSRSELGLDPSDVCLMSVGSLSWEKNPKSLLRLFSELAAADPRLKLVFVGEGPLEPELRQQAGRDGVTGRVRFLGVRSDVPALLSGADIFVLSSTTEGLPGVLIEAGMAGLPAVAFGVGSVAEVIKDGVTGFVVPPGDEAQFRARVVELARHTDRRRRMAQEALRFCRREFDIERSVKRHEVLFTELLHASAAHASALSHKTAEEVPSSGDPVRG